MPHVFSPIQNHIISALKNAKTLRYSQLQPEAVANDLFNYHLQFLVKKELVLKTDDGYALSEMGVRYVADPYPDNNGVSSLFKINVITIVSRVHDGKTQILNQLRTSNPSFGKVGVMGGVVNKGEPIEAAAARKLKQETGLEARFRLVGCERRVMYKNNELFSDVMFPIAYADTYSGNLIEKTQYGENKWVGIDEAIQNESAQFDSIHTITTILSAVRDGSISSLPFIFEESFQSDTE